jgi:hypothetical protein
MHMPLFKVPVILNGAAYSIQWSSKITLAHKHTKITLPGKSFSNSNLLIANTRTVHLPGCDWSILTIKNGID